MWSPKRSWTCNVVHKPTRREVPRKIASSRLETYTLGFLAGEKYVSAMILFLLPMANNQFTTFTHRARIHDKSHVRPWQGSCTNVVFTKSKHNMSSRSAMVYAHHTERTEGDKTKFEWQLSCLFWSQDCVRNRVSSVAKHATNSGSERVDSTLVGLSYWDHVRFQFGRFLHT